MLSSVLGMNKYQIAMQSPDLRIVAVNYVLESNSGRGNLRSVGILLCVRHFLTLSSSLNSHGVGNVQHSPLNNT